jgi:hypothetical protein
LEVKIEKSKKFLSPFLTSSYENQKSRIDHYFRLKRACSPNYRGASFCAPGRKQARIRKLEQSASPELVEGSK